MSNEEQTNEPTKEERLVDFIKVIDEIDKQMLPYREHRAATKQSYKENGWLTKEEMSLASKAYRLLKADQDVNQIVDYFNLLKDKGVR